jgi:hypothetical protein
MLEAGEESTRPARPAARLGHVAAAHAPGRGQEEQAQAELQDARDHVVAVADVRGRSQRQREDPADRLADQERQGEDHAVQPGRASSSGRRSST